MARWHIGSVASVFLLLIGLTPNSTKAQAYPPPGYFRLPAQVARPAASGSHAGQDLTAVDWANRTYSPTCVPDHPQPIKIHAGRVTVGSFLFQVYPPTYGDLTGDGHPEAVVPYSCTGADFWGVQDYVFSGSATHPVLLGIVPSKRGTNGDGVIASVAPTRIDHGVLTLTGIGYTRRAAHCCPNLRITMRYGWRAGALRLLTDDVVPDEAGPFGSPEILPQVDDASNGRWRLGEASSPGATIQTAQVPGCREGPCPDTLTVRFDNGRIVQADADGGVAEIGRVDATHFLILGGFCYLNCTLHIWVVDTAAHSFTSVLDRTTYFPIPDGECGLPFSYGGLTYTAKAVSDRSAQIVADHWVLLNGGHSCR